MNNIPREIFGEILSRVDHESQLVSRSVCIKWKEIINTKKYIGTCTDFIDMCLNNKFFFFDKFIEVIYGDFFFDYYDSYNYDPDYKKYIVTFGYTICQKFKYYKLAQMIRKERSYIRATEQHDNIIYYSIMFDDNYIDAYIRLINYDKKTIVRDLYKIFIWQFFFKLDPESYFLRLVKKFSLDIIKKLYARSCVTDGYYFFNNKIIDCIIKCGFNFCSDQTILFDLIPMCKSYNIIRIIENNDLKTKIKSDKIIEHAIKRNKYVLVKYLFKINPKFIKCDHLIRVTICDFKNLLRSTQNNKKILQLLLNIQTISYVEKKLIMMYMIRLKKYDRAKIFIQHGIIINFDPKCFVIRSAKNIDKIIYT